jgi:hypothetical protein
VQRQQSKANGELKPRTHPEANRKAKPTGKRTLTQSCHYTASKLNVLDNVVIYIELRWQCDKIVPELGLCVGERRSTPACGGGQLPVWWRGWMSERKKQQCYIVLSLASPKTKFVLKITLANFNFTAGNLEAIRSSAVSA